MKIALLSAAILVVVLALITARQYKTSTLIVRRVDRRDHLEPYPFYGVFVDEDGKRLTLHRNDLTNSDEVWEKLQEGQELLLDHRFIFWQFGEKRIALYHKDYLTNPSS